VKGTQVVIQNMTALLGRLAAVLTAIAGYGWWAYRRGEASGKAKARQEALEARVAELEAERGHRRIRQG
jgi:hypothetical protein